MRKWLVLVLELVLMATPTIFPALPRFIAWGMYGIAGIILCWVAVTWIRSRHPDWKTMIWLSVSGILLIGALITGWVGVRRTWKPTSALVFVFAPPWPLREINAIPGDLDTQAIPFGVRNTTSGRLQGVGVKWMSIQKPSQRGYDALHRPLQSVDGQESVSMNPGDTMEFVFAKYLIAKDGTRSIHLPIKNMNIRPGYGPDQEGFPIVYRIGMQVSSETSPVTYGRFTLTMTEEGWSFVPENTETAHP